MHPADYIINALRGRKIIILGFGKEGVSSYLFLRKHFPDMPITVADGNPNLRTDEFDDPALTYITGEGYDQGLNNYDLILKTPGISLNHLNYFVDTERISSQSDLFLQA